MPPSPRRALALLALSAAALLAACTSAGGSTATSEATPTAEATPRFEPRRVGPPVPLDPTRPLTDLEVRTWSDRLIGLDSVLLGDFFAVARGTRDERFVVPLIEAMRFYEPEARLFFTDTLELITGVELPGDDTWGQWYVWLAARPELPRLIGYETWKADLYRSAGGGSPFERFLIEGRETSIPLELIQFSGSAIEGFPTLDPPPLIAGSTASYLELDEPVIGVAIDGDARAYPLRILDWHETVNDAVGGVPITVAYCTFCGSGDVWDRRLEPGAEPLTFGFSGLIYEATRLLHDEQSDNLWSPLTGEPVHGPLVGDAALRQLPSIQTTWGRWLAAHPDTLVLDIDTGYTRQYVFDTQPAAYRASDLVTLPYAQSSALLPPKELVYSISLDGGPRVAYRLQALRAAAVANDLIEGTPIVLVADGPDGGIRAFERGDSTFEVGPAGAILDQTGARWTVTERGLAGPNGELRPRIVGTQAFWFAHFVYFPAAEVRTLSDP